MANLAETRRARRPVFGIPGRTAVHETAGTRPPAKPGHLRPTRQVPTGRPYAPTRTRAGRRSRILDPASDSEPQLSEPHPNGLVAAGASSGSEPNRAAFLKRAR